VSLITSDLKSQVISSKPCLVFPQKAELSYFPVARHPAKFKAAGAYSSRSTTLLTTDGKTAPSLKYADIIDESQTDVFSTSGEIPKNLWSIA
jgi:hypothetical protein